MDGRTSSELPPGFRFHPTDEELIIYYLCNQATSKPCPASIIPEVDIYKFDPWELPGIYFIVSKFGCIVVHNVILHASIIIKCYLLMELMQIKQALEKMNGTSLAQERGNIQMG